MGIEKFIKKICVQTAVYWGTPVPDGYGGYIFDDPVEILCRWEDKVELIDRVGERLGEQIISKAQVLVTQDLNEQGYLYLGTLNDLDSDTSNPKEIKGAYMIKWKTKIPMIRSTTEFVRKVYL